MSHRIFSESLLFPHFHFFLLLRGEFASRYLWHLYLPRFLSVNDVRFDIPITVYVLDRNGYYIQKFSVYANKKSSVIVPPGNYTLKTETYENYSNYTSTDQLGIKQTNKETNYYLYREKPVQSEAGEMTSAELNDDCVHKVIP